jgi:hypothetical protein
MNFYMPRPMANEYDNLRCVNPEDAVLFSSFMKNHYRHQQKNVWNPIDVKVEPIGKHGDFPSFISCHLVFTDKSWEIVYPLIASSIEPLILNSTEGAYTTIKIVDIVDCLDYSRSTYKRSAGGILLIDSYIFKEELVKEKNIFWLPEAYQTIVSDTFKDCVESSGLEGLAFEQIT